ncbi:PAS domain-containing protein [Bradyrhizobium sp. LB9.1b]
MSGVIVSMRRTLLSCTSLVRNGVLGSALAALLPAAPAEAADLVDTLSTLLDFNRQELAVLATALALLGFSVVAAILLMRTRVRTARNEARLRARIGELQLQADRFGALLFAEPQILISWPAGDNRAQISGDISMVLPRDSSPQRLLAFGTWLPPEPALQMDHAVDALRDRGDGFQLTLTTAHGHTLEAIGRAIGGQAIVRIRELSGLRRDLAETNLRYKALSDETEMLRGFAAAAPWPIWAKSENGALTYANPAYVRATEAATIADAQARKLELLDSADRTAMERGLKEAANFTSRLPIVISGERRIYDVRAVNVGRGNVGVAIDASEADALSSALVRMAEAHRRTLDQLSSGVAVFDGQRRLAFYNDSYRRLRGTSTAPSSTPTPMIPACSISSAPGASCLSSRISAPGRSSCTRPTARSRPPRTPGTCPTAAHSPSSPRRIRKAASPICSTTSPRASSSPAASTA